MTRYQLTWDPGARRWRKFYRGQRYVVSCRELGCPENKIESYPFALEWWEAKKKSLDSEATGIIPETVERIAWLRAHDEPDLADRLEAIRGNIIQPLVDRGQESLARDLVHHAPFHVQEGFRALIQAAPTKHTLTVEQASKDYLEYLSARVAGESLSVSDFDLARLCVRYFVDFLGSSNCVSVITSDAWQAFYTRLLSEACSKRYKKHRLAYARRFVTWLANHNRVEVPANLRDRTMTFKGREREVRTVPVAKLQEILGKARGYLRLHVLLMLNCGFSQKDISDLRPEEIDFARGVIDRRRSKTVDMKTPYVRWKLWKPTLELLRQYARQTGEHALLTERGNPWVRDEIVNGKRSKSDNLKTLWVNAELDSTPLSLFRKTGATLIKEEFGSETSDHWLGHGPKNVSDKSYWAKNQSKLDAAIDWLGKTIGI